VVLGSPAFIAPERARGELASPASDLWALGATLYAACEGRSPHDRVEAMAALTAVLHEEPAPPRNAGPIASVLMGLLVKDPAQRMTADQATRDLARAARGEIPVTEVAGSAATWRDVPDTVHVPGPRTSAYGRREPDTDATVRELNGSVPGGVGTPPRRDTGTRGKPKAVLLIVLAVLLVAAVCVVLLTRHSAGSASAGPSRTPTTPARTPAPIPSATIPPGFSPAQGPRGASIALPSGWTRRAAKPDSVQWVQPSTGAQVQLDTTPWGVADPVQHWKNFSREVAADGFFTGFRQAALGPRFTPRGWPASDLEFTWTTKDHGAMVATDRGFTVNGRQYALFVAYPADRRGEYADLLSTIFSSFQPPRQ
jgi:hypothetical protein